MRAAQAITAVVLAVIVVGAVVLGMQPDTRRARDGDVVVWSVLRRDVTRVEVVPPDAPRWSVDPASRTIDGVPADPGALSDLLDAIEETHRGVVVQGEPAAFGLDRPVRVRVDRLGEQVELLVGDDAPVGGRTYVQVPGGPIVAGPGGIGVVRQPVEALWSRAVVPEAAEEVTIDGREVPRSAWPELQVIRWGGDGEIVGELLIDGTAVGIGGVAGARWVRFEDGRIGQVGAQLDGWLQAVDVPDRSGG